MQEVSADLDLLGPALITDPLRIGLIHDVMAATMDGGQGPGPQSISPVGICLASTKTNVSVTCWAGHIWIRCQPVTLSPVPLTDRQLAEQLQEQGHTKLQLKSGGRHIDEDIDAVHAVAKVIRPGVDLFVDCNRGWTVGEAIQVSRACRDLKFDMEQPCATYAECATARTHLHHPLVLDESATDLATIARAISTGVADGFGMKLTRIGGISGMRAVRDLLGSNTPTVDDSGGDIACLIQWI